MTRIVYLSGRDRVDSGALEGALGALGAVSVGDEEHAVSRFLDAADGRLAEHGALLEWRDRGSGASLHLRETHPRARYLEAGAPNCPRVAADIADPALRAAVAALLGERALVATAPRPLCLRRYAWRDGSGRRAALLGFHDYAAGEDGVPPWQLLQLAPRKGHGKTTRALAAVLVRQLPLAVLAPAAVGALEPPQAGRDGPCFPLGADQDSASAVAAVLATLAAELRATQDGIVADLDVEYLHDFRVTLRRTRSVLAAFRHLLPDTARARFRADFAWLSAATGPLRDLDVLLAELGPASDDGMARALLHLRGTRARARARVLRVLGSARYARCLEAWDGTLARLGEADAACGDTIGTSAARAIRRAYRRLARRADDLSRPPSPAALHRLRKDGKRLRYLVEAFASLYSRRRTHKLTRDLKQLQTLLGAACDRHAQHALLGACARDHAARADAELAAALRALAATCADRADSHDEARLARLLKRFTGDRTRARFARLADASRP